MEENALEQQAYTVYVLSPNPPSCSFVALADGIEEVQEINPLWVSNTVFLTVRGFLWKM